MRKVDGVYIDARQGRECMERDERQKENVMTKENITKKSVEEPERKP